MNVFVRARPRAHIHIRLLDVVRHIWCARQAYLEERGWSLSRNFQKKTLVKTCIGRSRADIVSEPSREVRKA